MPSKPELLRGHHDRIVAWRAQGLTLRDVADRLRVEGLKVDHNAVARYCKRAGIEAGQSSAAGPEAETAIQVVPQYQPVAPPPPPPPERFPRLDVYRETVLRCIQQGCSARMVWAVICHGYSCEVGEEEVAAYVQSLIHAFYPPGTIQHHLLEIQPHDGSWPDDMPVLTFGDVKNPANHWTVSDACQGTLILGATGSGKTSGSGRLIADEFIAHGFGGLVLTTKPGEVDDWLVLLGRRGRDRDISVIRPDSPLHLNMLQYESTQSGQSAVFTENIVAFFKNLVSVLNAGRPEYSGTNFWRQTGDQLLRNLIECFLLAGEPLTFDSLCEFIGSAPLHPSAAREGYWQGLGLFGVCLGKARAAGRHNGDAQTLRRLEQYWLGSFPVLVPETRSCITIAFEAMVDSLRDRHIHNLISGDTTITPEAIMNGRVVVIDLPINQYHEAGLLVQAAWKYLFQRAVLRRADRSWRERCRPVFLWEDEAQNFLIDFDAEFQRVARESRVARVMLTQNINNLFDRFGGDGHAHSKINSLIGNLNTRIFHANGDLATNQFASAYIGTEDQIKVDMSVTPTQYHGINPLEKMMFHLLNGPVKSHSYKTVREPVIHPHFFNTLKMGGQRNNFVTEAIVTQVGRRFAQNLPCAAISIPQLLLPKTLMPHDEPAEGYYLRHSP